MADFLWTFAVQEALKKVVNLAAEQTGLAWGLEEELSKLKKWLLKAETILRDINVRKLHHDSVRMWVDDLQHLVYQADDLLDELAYEDLRRKAQTEKLKKVWDFLSPTNNAFIFRTKMVKKIKNVMDLLYKHYCEASPLELVGDESAELENDLSQLRETVSEIDDHNVVGRDVEVESIVKQVIDASRQQVTSILPIVGMGGLGKTTLARAVFNHEMIQQHFHKSFWVCVSEPFIVNKILGAILQSLKCTLSGGDNKEVLLREIQKEMHGQRYFLVLDDVWNENPYLWDELKYCLIRITERSENSIVVTTRSAGVAKIVETLPSHHLSKLSDDQCWSLFKESASASGLSMTSSLEVIREELVKKFGGIPLVARVLGRAVKFEGDYERWVTILKSIVRTPLQEESFVLSILKLSVDRLPSSSLKQCFAYCSNFPKDYVFCKKELVQMWMAQGFIQLQQGGNNLSMEDIGDMYFNFLLSRCLFQDSFKDENGRIISCKMHDLVHDIACEVSKENNLQLDISNLLNEKHWKKGSKTIASKLRTMDCYRYMFHKKEKMIEEKIVKFVNLRVLIMEPQCIYKLPNSIGRLKHLRYLHILGGTINKLPESIVLLYNLQTLKIESLPIKDLPKNLRELVSLRHLEFSINSFVAKKMPPYLSQLTQLQTLSSFVVGCEKGCKITELGFLKDLKGSLKLDCLEQVKSKEEASTAKLVDKEKLDSLTFYWSNGNETRKDNNQNDLEVLEGLQPHKNLQSLEISNFGGKCLPNKIFVENLVTIHLWSCNKCEKLPMLGQLTNLEILTISSLPNVRSIGKECYGNDSNQRAFFPQLKTFAISWMSNLERWEEVTVASNATTFPHLQKLRIISCPVLLNIPDHFGSSNLKSLEISSCEKLTKLPDGLQLCHSVQDLRIYQGSNLSLNLQNKNMLSRLSIGPLNKLPHELAHLMNLQEMKIYGCMQNYDFSLLMHLHSLTNLHLVNEKLSSATQLPHQLGNLTALQILLIENFGGVEALPEWLGNLTCLHTLGLYHCENLKQLASAEAMLRLTKLRTLYAYECPQLQLDQRDIERTKLSHLPTIHLFLNCYFRFL